MTTIQQIEKVLDTVVRPELAKDGGNLETLSFEDGVYTFKFLGECAGCAAADITARQIVEEGLKAAFPDIKEVVLDQRVSEDLLDFARQILAGKIK